MHDDAVITAIAVALDRWQVYIGRQCGLVSRSQRHVLSAMADSRTGLRVRDVATISTMTAAGATRMVDTLEARGYVQRLRRPGGDQREVYVTITDDGAAALRTANGVYAGQVARTTTSLTDREKVTLAHLLAKVEATALCETRPLGAL